MTSTNFTLWSQFVEKTATQAAAYILAQMASDALENWLFEHGTAANLGKVELGSVAIMTFQEARNCAAAVEEAVVIEVQRTFEGQKRAQIGPEGGLKDAGFYGDAGWLVQKSNRCCCWLGCIF